MIKSDDPTTWPRWKQEIAISLGFRPEIFFPQYRDPDLDAFYEERNKWPHPKVYRKLESCAASPTADVIELKSYAKRSTARSRQSTGNSKDLPPAA